MDAGKVRILSLDNLEIGYDTGRKKRILLPPVSASAHKGELIAIIGRNGSGKSTLIRTILGLQPFFGGNIEVSSENLRDIPRMELARRIGYISTEIIRVSNMTVWELVALGRFPHTNWIGRIDPASREAIDSAVSLAGMSTLSQRYISELSDGERQRVMIARVLAQDAGIMMMDEPTAFLDLPGKYEIANLVRGLTYKGKTIIFSTHDLSIALKLADRIWLMLRDRLTEGSPEELLRNGSLESMFEIKASEGDASSGVFIRDYLKNFL